MKIDKHLYARKLKTKTSYFTQIDGQYVPLGDNEADARRSLNILLGRAANDTIESMCKGFIEEQRQLLIDNDPSALAKRTLEDYEEALTKRIVPVFGHMRPSQFKPMHAAQYLAAGRAAKRAVRANREIAALGSAFNYGMAQGACESNPCRGVRRNKERPRSRSVSIAELNAFLSFAKGIGGSMYMVALIGCMVAITGRRRSEVLSLSRHEIGALGVEATDSKVDGREYLIEWSSLLSKLFAEAQAIREGCVSSMFAFPTESGQPYTDRGFKALWNRLMHRYAASGGEWFRAHDLRALYVSEMLARGENPNTHRNTETMHRVYDRRRTIKVKPLA